MTTVLAYGDGRDRVWMASDSMASIYDRPVEGVTKIIRKPVQLQDEGMADEVALLGASGDIAMLAVIQSLDMPFAPTDPLDGLDHWAHQIADDMTVAATERGLSDNGRISSPALLAFRGLVWTLTHGYALPHPDHVAAIGSGEGIAIGALDALLDVNEMGLFGPHLSAPAHILSAAMHVAKRRDIYTGGKIYIEGA